MDATTLSSNPDETSAPRPVVIRPGTPAAGRRGADRRVAAWACAIAAALIALVLLGLLVQPRSIDFHKAYFPVARAVLSTGAFAYTYDGFKNLPVVALLLAPLGLVGPGVGAQLLFGSELVAYALAFLLFARYLTSSATDRVVLFFLFVTSRPFYTSLWLGQLTPHTFLLLVGMTAAYFRGRKGLAGALLSGAFLLKIPAGLLFFYFLCKQQWSTVLAAVATFVVSLVISVAVFGPALHSDYYQAVIASSSGTTVLAYNNQNLFAFIMRYLHAPALFDWSAVAIPLVLNLLLSLPLALGLGWLLSQFAERRQTSRAVAMTEIGALTCITVMIFTISWDHYYLFLIMPFFAAYANLGARWRSAAGGIWTAALVLVNLPAPLTTAPARAGVPFGITLVSAPFLGCVLLLALLLGQYFVGRVRNPVARDQERQPPASARDAASHAITSPHQGDAACD